MTQRAVLVGINYYNTQHKLSGCINDVYRVADILRNVYKFPNSNIVILTDDHHYNSAGYPSKVNIVDALNTLVNSTKPGDVAVFHYSGHGVLFKPQHDPLGDALVPADVLNRGYYDKSRELTDDELWNIITRLPKNSFLFSAIDACHSGTAFDLPYNLYIDKSNKSTFSLQKIERRPETDASIVMLSGCRDDQTSLDAVDHTNKPAGALTYALCQYIINNHHRAINLVDMLLSLRQMIQQNNPKTIDIQEPQLDFGRISDAGLTFTLLPNGMMAQLTKEEQATAKDILNKVYDINIPEYIQTSTDVAQPIDNRQISNNKHRMVDPRLRGLAKQIAIIYSTYY